MNIQNTQLKPSINNLYRPEFTPEDMQRMQEEIKNKEIEKDDVKDSLVRFLISNEKWDYQKSVNFSNLMDTMFSSTPSRPQVHEKVLTVNFNYFKLFWAFHINIY